MRLNALDSLACVGPDLNLTVLTAGVAPALLVEADACEKSRSVLATHDTWLLEALGHISGMPEAHLLGSHGSEAKVVCTLGPCNINDAIC